MEEILAELTRTTYPLSTLMERPLPDGVDPVRLETYLSDTEFRVSSGTQTYQLSATEFRVSSGTQTYKSRAPGAIVLNHVRSSSGAVSLASHHRSASPTGSSQDGQSRV